MCVAVGYRCLISFLVLIAVALTVACGLGGREPATGLGFHAEIAVEAESPPGDPLARFGPRERRSVIRW